MDSILDRVESARLLLANGRYFDGFLLGLIAFAGLSSLRYPRKSVDFHTYFSKKRSRHPNLKIQIDAEENKRAAQVKHHPDRRFLGDKETFHCLVYDEIGKITGPNMAPALEINVRFPYGADLQPMNFEDILYGYLRCTSVHQGKFPPTVILTQPIYMNTGLAYNQVKLSVPNGWPLGWVENILKVVEGCPEVASASIDSPLVSP